jgi:hypothetical protein
MTKKPENIAIDPATLAEGHMRQVTIAHDDVVLSREEIGWVVEALILGLTSYGELEKVFTAKKFVQLQGEKWPAYLDVRHPGPPDIVATFACALMTLNV